MSFKSKFVGVFGAAILTVSAVAGVAAQSASAPVSVQVNGSGQPLSVALENTQSFQAVSYNADAAQSTTGKFKITVSDPRGTGEGWNVKISANDDFRADGDKSFPLSNNLTMTDGSLEGNAKGVTKSAVTMTAAQQTILSAQTRSGMGNVAYKDINTTVNVPAGTLSGTYKTTLNVQIASGPN